MKKHMIMAATLASSLAFVAVSANAQTPGFPLAQDFGLPEGTVLMWPRREDAPPLPEFLLPSVDVPVPEGYEALSANPIFPAAAVAVAYACEADITQALTTCSDGSGIYTAGGINERGQVCTCGFWILSCRWENPE
jgi:hypothetical protein